MNRAAILGACVLLAGCAGGSEDDLQAWMNEQAKTMRGAVRALPELKPFPVVAYAGTQGDDPFRSARMEPERRASAGALRPDMDRRREPLESYPLESMQMVGILMQGRNTHALIKANKRFDFFILPGERHPYGSDTEYVFWLKGDYFCKHLIGDSSISTDIFEMNRETKMTPGKKGL